MEKHVVLILKYEQQLAVQQGAVLDQGHQAFVYPPDIRKKEDKEIGIKERTEDLEFH